MLPPPKLRATGQAFSLTQARFAPVLLSLVLTAPACLDVLGDVDVGSAEPSIDTFPNKTSADAGACGDEALSSGACVVDCTPGERRCSGALLQSCNENGNGWELRDQCASAALCDSDALICSRPACADGQHLCTEQGELLICRTDRTDFEHKQQCQSGAYCSSVSGSEGCEGLACRAGRQRCNGAQIEQCRADRTGFDVIGEPCASAALCKEGVSGIASCDAPSCTPGQFRCEGARLMRCSDDGGSSLEMSTCESEQLCNAAEQRCEPPPCTAGQQRCTANVLERCNATQTAFTPVETCTSELLCDPGSPGCLTTPAPPPLDDTPYTFVSMSGSSTSGLGPLTLTLPAEWADTDSRPWTNARGETLGPRLIASTDAARFASRFDIPGVLFEATADAPVSASARLNELDLSALCTRGASAEYDDGLYYGTSQTWTNCSGTNATTVVVAAVPDDQAFVTIVIVTMVAERDQDARRTIWESFVVQASPP
jgi:hypothetical protein